MPGNGERDCFAVLTLTFAKLGTHCNGQVGNVQHNKPDFGRNAPNDPVLHKA